MIKRDIQTILLLLITILLISLGSCDPGRKFEENENEKILEYLSVNSNLNFDLKPSGLYSLDFRPGSGYTTLIFEIELVKVKAGTVK